MAPDLLGDPRLKGGGVRGGTVSLFPRTRVTSGHECTGFKPRKLTLPHFRRPEPQDQSGSRACPLQRLRGRDGTAPQSQLLVAVPGVPWLLAASLQSLSLSSHGSVLSASRVSPSSPKDAAPNPGGLIPVPSIASAKILSPNKVACSWVAAVWPWMYFSGGCVWCGV